MRKTALMVVAVAAIGSGLATAPAEARGWHRGGFGWGPGIGFGLAAGALAAGPVPVNLRRQDGGDDVQEHATSFRASATSAAEGNCPRLRNQVRETEDDSCRGLDDGFGISHCQS